MEPLIGGGVTDAIQTFLAFCSRQRIPRASVGLMSAKNVNALCPIDASGEKKSLWKANIGVRAAIGW